MSLTPSLPHPMLFYGICFLLGIASHLAFTPIYFLILLFVILLWKKQLFKGCLFMLLGFIYGSFSVTLPTISEEGVQGKGIFYPQKVSYAQTSFGSSWRVEGILKKFETEDTTWKNIPCLCYVPPKKKRLESAHAWKVEGRLIPKGGHRYALKPSQVTLDLSNKSLAEWRFQKKDQIRKQLVKLFKDPSVHAFLLSAITAEMDHHLLALHFNKIGLVHLLGVSGFQFSMLFFVLYKVLRLFLSYRCALYLLLTFFAYYTVILGYTPPVGRAFMMIALSITASLYSLQTSQLNRLGVALMAQLLISPYAIFHLGFQFSFLCTLGLICIYPGCKSALDKVLIKRSFIEVRNLSLLDKIGYRALCLGKELLSLNISVSLIAFPLMLYHFHKVPLLGVLYNLFLPPMISAAYVFLLPALFLSYFSHLLALPFVKVTEALTKLTLFLAENPPQLFDVQWRISEFSAVYAVIYLSCLTALFYKRSRLFHEFF
ncbi:ComEC/Rec2 family competence protein [Rhabdochlamydiaceae symbiont of Dictyostelium giganteum]|uniref:ComEC/Rec2 family competence protein n=1 Tax=Rhabdochlamydiaceae symbiont of Dictyostelium giganteum TaxID=3342349 RepID=UPI00384EB568